MSKIRIRKIAQISLAVLLLPLIAGAQPEDFKGAVNSLTNFVSTLVPLLMAVALLVFFWGLATYVYSAGSDKKETSKQRMVWGVVGLFVITTIWGIVALIGGSISIL